MQRTPTAGVPCLVLGAAVVLLTTACDALRREDGALPDAPAVLALYEGDYAGVETAELSGNVVELRVRQPAGQLERGGSLWAKLGPYVYLFSPSTRQLLETYPGVAAVRVITLAPGGEEVARAMLLRESMTDIRWRRSLNLLGRALQEGTQRPSLLEDLVQWGEQNTEFRYNPEFVPQ